MNTIAAQAPTDHSSARCSEAIAGAAVNEDKELSAAAVYAITHSTQTQRNLTQSFKRTRHHEPAANSVRVVALGHQRQRRLEQNVDIEQHRPVLDVIQVELDALLDFLFIVDLAAPAVDLRPAGDAGFYAVAREVTVDGFIEQPA